MTDLPLARCRGLTGTGFACVPSVGNPFVETACAILVEGDPPYEATPLHSFHRCFRPRTLAEILDVEPMHSELLRPPQALAFPWMAPLRADAEA